MGSGWRLAVLRIRELQDTSKLLHVLELELFAVLHSFAFSAQAFWGVGQPTRPPFSPLAPRATQHPPRCAAERILAVSQCWSAMGSLHWLAARLPVMVLQLGVH